MSKLQLRDHVRGNSKIKPAGWKHPYTQEELDEFQKCADDPIYFIRTYVKIVSLDKGIISFEMFKFQEEFIMLILNERKTIAKLGRQMGKTTCVAAAILWYIIFSDTPKNVAVLAHKASGAREILSRIKLSYELLPPFLQHGVHDWNKGAIHISNGSKVTAAATSASAARGGSINLCYLDEYAFVAPNIAEEFFASVFPTLSSGKSTKICITSTPIGYNAYWRIWDEAEKGINGFKTFTANYWDRTGYDEQWAAEQKRVLGDLKFRQEVLCAFLGSSNTLIAGDYIAKMVVHEPIYKKDGLDIYEKPEKDHRYVLVADTSRGIGGDSSTFSVIDISEVPYRMVAKYKSNTIHPMLYSSVIYKVARDYNDAYILVEINDNGQSISDALFHEMEYENMLFISKEKGGQRVSSGFGGGSMQSGVRTDKLVKRVGCSTLKTLVEENKLLVHDRETISEFSTFTEIKQSFAADAGYHDDCVMCLVLFAWLTTSPYFRELTDVNLRVNIYQQRIEAIESSLTPFGIRDDGHDDKKDTGVFEDGDLWIQAEVDRQKMYIQQELEEQDFFMW